MSPGRGRAWVERQRDALKGQPIYEAVYDDDEEEEGTRRDIEGEWTEVNSVVVSKMFGVLRPTASDIVRLQAKLEDFAKKHPERVAREGNEGIQEGLVELKMSAAVSVEEVEDLQA